MNSLRHLFLVAAWLATVAGCGPGVGGTGTGESTDGLAAFGAVGQALCAAPFADRLACPPATGGTTTPSPIGTAAVRYVDAAIGGQTSVLFEANRIEVDARCAGLRFSGEWGVAPSGAARFYGTVRIDGSASAAAAQLSVNSIAGSAANLELVLQAVDGSVLLGPVEVRPEGAGAPPPSGCGAL